MGGRVYFKICFLHKPPVAVLGHAFMSLDTLVNNPMLIKLALEAEFLPAGFTDDLFILLVFIEMAHFLRRVIKNVQNHDFYRVFKSF